MVDVKTINVTFTDEEHDQLIKKKNGTNWHDYIIELAKKEEK